MSSNKRKEYNPIGFLLALLGGVIIVIGIAQLHLDDIKQDKADTRQEFEEYINNKHNNEVRDAQEFEEWKHEQCDPRVPEEIGDALVFDTQIKSPKSQEIIIGCCWKYLTEEGDIDSICKYHKMYEATE